MSDQTPPKTLQGKLQAWCDQANVILGGGGGGTTMVPKSGELTGALKKLLDGKRPPAISEQDWTKYRDDIKNAIDGAELSDSDITSDQLKNVETCVEQIHQLLVDKQKVFVELKSRINKLKLDETGQGLLVASSDIRATVAQAENLAIEFATQSEQTMTAVNALCTPAFGSGGPSEGLLKIWTNTDFKTYDTLPTSFTAAMTILDLTGAESVISEMRDLPNVFKANLNRVLLFKKGRGEFYDGEELVELSELEAEYKAVILSCGNALRAGPKTGRTQTEFADLNERFERAKAVYDRTDLRALGEGIADADEKTVASLKYFVAIETDAGAAAEPKMTEQEERAWLAVIGDVDRQYKAFAATNFQNRDLRGVWIKREWRSDFMAKRFRLGRRWNIGGVVYTVAPSDSGSTSLHAPIPKNLQWFNGQGKLAKSFIYHY